ncbi:hypothetical protein D9M69_456170 [compost metagenome]
MLLANLLEHLLRLEGRQHDMQTTADEQHDNRGQVSQVEHRHGMQIARVRAIAYPVLGGEGGDTDVVVAEHDAFGGAGGAAGIENSQQGVAAAMRVFHRFILGDQRFVVEHALGRFAVAGIDHQPDALCFDGHLGA